LFLRYSLPFRNSAKYQLLFANCYLPIAWPLYAECSVKLSPANREGHHLRQLPVLVVHGGAWAIPDDMVQSHLDGVQKALDKGWHVLEGGGSALDAVEAAIACMEDDETFDAGRGSFLTRDGRVQLDALMMDGATLRAGGVGCVERIRNPISASRLVLDQSPHVYFVGEGAERFAQEHGIELCRNEELVIEREVRRLKE